MSIPETPNDPSHRRSRLHRFEFRSAVVRSQQRIRATNPT
ncbi:hypothetical protein KPSA3_01341 [Pseudomonas syringae pv. actinidiae]|uniref:Uncharacterized protein n=1 Tax=Pseudomonas syringae pv. actinidiae TaxID=103796 RepID=A0AAN4Q162_PSESF|nr:hypothetical protein KPSA3_01341 [Pseudomonas syringae pv. actinidiae]